MLNVHPRLQRILLTTTSDLVYLTDLDGTAFVDAMIPVLARFVRPEEIARLTKLFCTGQISNETFLRLRVEKMCHNASPGEILAYYRKIAREIPGFGKFVECLRQKGVHTIGVTNNVEAHAEAVLDHLDLEIPVVGNLLRGRKFHARHPIAAMRKGDVVEWFARHGKIIVGFGGDSGADIGGAKATLRLGGKVVAMANGDRRLRALADYQIHDYYEMVADVVAEMIEAALRSQHQGAVERTSA